MNDTQQSQIEGAPRLAPPPPARPRAKVYLNRSEDFSTAHGEIPKDDPFYGVMAIQNGLPFNHQDELMYDSPIVQSNPKLLARADKLVARAEKYVTAARQKKETIARSSRHIDEDDDMDGVDIEDAEDDADEVGPGPVNLNAWARGITDWPWQEVSNFIARKYGKRVGDKRAAAELCLEQHVVTLAQLSRPLQRLIDS